MTQHPPGACHDLHIHAPEVAPAAAEQAFALRSDHPPDRSRWLVYYLFSDFRGLVDHVALVCHSVRLVELAVHSMDRCHWCAPLMPNYHGGKVLWPLRLGLPMARSEAHCKKALRAAVLAAAKCSGVRILTVNVLLSWIKSVKAFAGSNATICMGRFIPAPGTKARNERRRCT